MLSSSNILGGAEELQKFTGNEETLYTTTNEQEDVESFLEKTSLEQSFQLREGTEIVNRASPDR